MARAALAANMSAMRFNITQLLDSVVDAVDGRRRALELLGGFAEAAGQLGQLGGAEEEHHDREDDEQFGRSEVHANPFGRRGPDAPPGRTPGGAPVSRHWLA